GEGENGRRGNPVCSPLFRSPPSPLLLKTMNPSSARTVVERYAEAPPAAAMPSFLDEVLAATSAAPGTTSAAPPAPNALDRFLAENDVGAALKVWLGGLVPDRWRVDLKRKLTQKLGADVAHIDALLTDQINAILHHTEFQKLEGSWRGLRYLV